MPRDNLSCHQWRHYHYNVLYDPDVIGLKPYSRRATHDDDADPEAKQRWRGFATSSQNAPSYNWQTAAAVLVAAHLRTATGQNSVTTSTVTTSTDIAPSQIPA